MFWKRKEIVSYKSNFALELPPVPPKKEYEIMLELLRNAEHLSHSGEFEVEKEQLEIVKSVIDRYINKDSSPK